MWKASEMTMGDLWAERLGEVSRGHSTSTGRKLTGSEEGPNLWTKKQDFPPCTSRVEGRNDREVTDLTGGNRMLCPVSKGHHEWLAAKERNRVLADLRFNDSEEPPGA